MYRVTLINMPFSSLNMPSLALTQLKSVLDRRFDGRVATRVLYFNHEFAHFLGLDLYETMNGVQASNAGLGDWIFRQIAFPAEPDNAEAYFQRYFPHHSPELAAIKQIVLDKRTSLERFLQRLIVKHRLDREDLLGFTSMFSQNVSSMAMARLVKEKNRNAVVVMGGANCEAPMGRELVRHAKAVDYVFSGPSLVSFPSFVGHRLAGKPEKCEGLPGVYSRSNLDSPHLAGRGAMGVELPIDVEVPLDYEPFLGEIARQFPEGRIKPYLTFETSRGCWWGERSHCTFCGLNGSTMAYRSMPVEMAVRFLQDLLDRYSDRCQRFESVDNILPREYLEDVLPKLRTPPGVSFFYEVKADLKEREMAILGRAGVTAIQPGIESLATSTLKLMRKGTSSFQNLAFLKYCRRYGIKPLWNLLIGFPNEPASVYEKYLRDLPRLVHLVPPSGAYPVRFDRFSPYFTQADSYGLQLSPYEFYRFIYPFGEEALRNMAYYFEDQNYRAAYLASVAAYQTRLQAAVDHWRARVTGQDGGLPARLDLIEESRDEDGEAVVRDTREGTLVEHRLSPLARRVLAGLYDRGRRPADLARDLGEDEAAVAAEVARLEGARLLFEEDGRYLSLVLEEAASEERPRASETAASETARAVA